MNDNEEFFKIPKYEPPIENTNDRKARLKYEEENRNVVMEEALKKVGLIK